MDRQTGAKASPFDYLLSLEDAILDNLSKEPTPLARETSWMGLSFVCGLNVLLTPLDEVQRILPVTNLASVPGVKPWLRGVTSYRGQIFPVTDLAGLSTQKLSPITKNTRIFMVQSQEGYCGLLVDRVLGLQHISKASKSTKNMLGLCVEYEPFMIGSIIISSSQLPIISCKRIVQHPRFRDCVLNIDETKGTVN